MTRARVLTALLLGLTGALGLCEGWTPPCISSQFIVMKS